MRADYVWIVVRCSYLWYLGQLNRRFGNLFGNLLASRFRTACHVLTYPRQGP